MSNPDDVKAGKAAGFVLGGLAVLMIGWLLGFLLLKYPILNEGTWLNGRGWLKDVGWVVFILIMCAGGWLYFRGFALYEKIGLGLFILIGMIVVAAFFV